MYIFRFFFSARRVGRREKKEVGNIKKKEIKKDINRFFMFAFCLNGFFFLVLGKSGVSGLRKMGGVSGLGDDNFGKFGW